MTSTDAPAPSEAIASLTRDDIASALSTYWAPGLALVLTGIAYLATQLVPVQGRASVWAPYLALGVVFPLATMVVIALPGGGKQRPTVRLLLAAVLPLAASILAGPLGAVIALGLACLQASAYIAWASPRRHITRVRALVICMTGYIAWAVMLQMFVWSPMNVTMPPTWPVLGIGALSLLACCWWVFGSRMPGEVVIRTPAKLLDAAAIVALVLLAFRTDGLFITDRLGTDGTFYHWGVMVGPAEAVRQGGWLLWDTPSPYGFLTTLTLAVFPAATAWQSLYLLNAIASAALAIWLYTILRTNRPPLPGAAFALLASAAVVFLVSTYPPMLTPEHYYPMSGAFRYGWCFVFVAVLLQERAAPPHSHRQKLVLFLGTVGWLLSMLWSAESAVYGSIIWLPAFILIVLRDHRSRAGPRNWKVVIAWLLAPPLMLVAALSLIVMVYQRALGHPPDAMLYIESIVTFAGSRASEVSGLFPDTSLPTTVVAPVFGFLLLAAVAARLARVRAAWRDLPVVLALALGTWALISYPVGQSFLFAAYRLMPFIMLAFAIVIVQIVPLYQGQPDDLWIDVLRGGCVALLTTLLVSVYANFDQLGYYIHAVRTEGIHVTDVTVGLPHVDPSLQDLMQQAGITPADAIFYGGGQWGETMPVWVPQSGPPVIVSKQWLAGPLSTMAFREDDRKQTFLQRAADRQLQGGWLIERQQKDDLIYAVGPWFFAQIHSAFVPAAIATNNEWQLVRYETVTEWRARFGDRLPSGGAPDLPTDFVITGASSPGTILPAVWGYFGSEWTSASGKQAWRCTPGQGTLNVFVSSAQQAELSLRLDASEADLDITVNDASVDAASIRGARVAISLMLDPGWNVVTLSHPGAAAERQPEPLENAGCTAGPDGAPLQIRDVTLRLKSGATPQ